MHADVTQEAEQLKKQITTLGNNLFTPMNMFEAKNPDPTKWITLMQEVSAFVTPKTDMMSARLKTGLKACLDTSKYLTENVIKTLGETNDVQEKQSHATILAAALTNASTPLTKAMSELQTETYRFSADKRAAKNVVEHLSAVLMTAVARVSADAQKLENQEKKPAPTPAAEKSIAVPLSKTKESTTAKAIRESQERSATAGIVANQGSIAEAIAAAAAKRTQQQTQ